MRRLPLLVPVLMGKSWTPKKLPGLTCWLRADDIAGNDGDLVAAWNDHLGNGNNFAQATETNKPTLKTGANGINSHNVVRFATDNFMLGSSNFLSGTTGAAFFVYRVNSVIIDNQSLLTSADEATANYFVILRGLEVTGFPRLLYSQKNNDTTDELRASSTLSINSSYVVAFSTNGSTVSVRLNGAAETLSVVTGGNNGDWFGDVAERDNVVLGAFKTTTVSQYLNGDLAEVIVCDGVNLSIADIQKTEKYLSKRYNINFT